MLHSLAFGGASHPRSPSMFGSIVALSDRYMAIATGVYGVEHCGVSIFTTNGTLLLALSSNAHPISPLQRPFFAALALFGSLNRMAATSCVHNGEATPSIAGECILILLDFPTAGIAFAPSSSLLYFIAAGVTCRRHSTAGQPLEPNLAYTFSLSFPLSLPSDFARSLAARCHPQLHSTAGEPQRAREAQGRAVLCHEGGGPCLRHP